MSEFKAKRMTQACDVTIAAPAARVFPLLCPVREFDWIDGWNCDLIYSDSGLAENNCIFRTDREGEGRRTWLVSRYEPNKIIEFVIYLHDWGITKMDLYLSENGEGGSTLRVIHTITALNPQGNALIEAMPKDLLRQRWAFLERAINHYLSTGDKLRR